ncbi:elongation factor P [Candidatus Kaiserbacteria bacterium]|nr:elongation factor P [Candidatus Kaiserbacteria bacterium]
MLAYNEILPKKVIIHNDEPFVVVSAHVFRKQQRKPVNQTKLKGLKSGKFIEQTFHQNESVREADISDRPITFLYGNRGEYFFCEPDDPSKRFSLAEDLVGPAGKYLKPKSEVTAIVYNDEIIGVTLPIKMELMVTEADPATKGNTAQGATKEVVLETGATIMVPMFINQGDVIRINTETDEYTERISKS